jgi:SRSO17 transposase
MLSESTWDRRNVRRQLIADANVHFGYASALLIDESAFAKKGDLSAGVARQWNGRLGKTDNSRSANSGASWTLIPAEAGR